MKTAYIGKLALRTHLAFSAFGGSNIVAALLCLAGALCWLWWIPQQQTEIETQQAELRDRRAALLAMPAAPLEAAISPAQADLAAFYAVLGDRRRAEAHIRVLFDIARASGLTLAKGEYKSEKERNSQSYSYQILLPMTGSYNAIRQFCERVLLAIPFASLDEISFRRDAIGNGALDARLRFTFYLSDAPVVRQGQKLATMEDHVP
jgi:hypothetical protein